MTFVSHASVFEPRYARNGRGAPEEIVPPLKAQSGGKGDSAPMLALAASVRRLMPVECERLQALPDGWTDLGGTPDSRRYAGLGDAVTASVAEWIGRRIIAVSAPQEESDVNRARYGTPIGEDGGCFAAALVAALAKGDYR